MKQRIVLLGVVGILAGVCALAISLLITRSATTMEWGAAGVGLGIVAIAVAGMMIDDQERH